MSPSASPPDRPGAQEWVPGQPTVARLAEAVEACRGCELWADATHGVGGSGPADAELMVVGEQPGDSEDRQGRPFVGPAGRLLDRALEEAGLRREDVFVTNAVKHFRHLGRRGKQRIHKTPSRVHVAACGPWLVAELDVVRPRGVVLLGATAGQAVFGSGLRITADRGHPLPWPGAEATHHAPDWGLVTAHPSAVLRSPQRDRDEALLVADLRVAVDALTST